MTLAEFVGISYIFVGILLVVALLQFFGGFISYLVHLGTEQRDAGLGHMKDGNTILFVLIIIIAVVELIQRIFA